MTEQGTDDNQWQALGFRLTAFFASEAQLSLDDWWAQVGGEAESTSSNPKLGHAEIKGSLNGNLLVLSTKPGRVDWRWVAAETAVDGSEGVGLGGLAEAIPAFLELATSWLQLEGVGSSIDRLALGAKLIQPVASREEGYRRLNGYLPVLELKPEDTDLRYQINRPRVSRTGIEGLMINRLAQWFVETVKVVEIGAAAVHSSEVANRCSLELDVNTSQEYSGDWTTDDLLKVLKELAEFAEEIADQGDIQ